VANNVPLPYSIESTTDLAIRRTGNSEDQIAMGDAGPFLVSNGLTVIAWDQEYKLVARANQQLQGMQKNAANVDAKTYGRMRAEVLVLRAWAYFHLMSQFGDVPYYRDPLTTEQIFTLSRTP
jgi:hypothetical protein